MKCPHCARDIPDRMVAIHLARKGGLARKHPYRPTSEKARAMAMLAHKARRRNKMRRAKKSHQPGLDFGRRTGAV